MKKRKAKIEQTMLAAMKPTKEAKTVFQKPNGLRGCSGSSIRGRSIKGDFRINQGIAQQLSLKTNIVKGARYHNFAHSP